MTPFHAVSGALDAAYRSVRICLHRKEVSVLSVICCTFSLHAHGQAFLIAAVLAAVSLALVDHAVLVVSAGVGQVLPYGSLKEPLAALAAVDAVVFT